MPAQLREKLNLPGVTLVTVSSINVPDTIDALMYSLRGINFGAVKLVTHETPRFLPAQIEYCQCPKISSLDEYSHYILYHLKDHVDTEYCLVIQQNGFVLNPHLWQDQFLEYDYIGAPWPPQMELPDSQGRCVRVGNGGFSLRSKKLLSLPSDLGLPFEMKDGLLNEDMLLCASFNTTLEQHGVRFAPVDVARWFSHEHPTKETEAIKPFGFHDYFGENRFYPRFPSVMTSPLVHLDHLDEFDFYDLIKNNSDLTKIEIEELFSRITIQLNHLVTEREQLVTEQKQLAAERDAILNSNSWKLARIIASMKFWAK
ncbi:DUF5672 family protein [Solemya velum gill symbiont]|uniref:DUF5672 family protein n=1 Tax=Solemya velum gill symbiont TaxID=2340 RepID=UPI0009960176|nr:DUF5672 family protein [Solemya velum gill symbiont]OOY36566.1 hypothetical protein BOV89_11890 [Solemya velum gill symbiont]OOY38941.1 hypothetical protein BOV90_11915 [Solemya velum gill symbiont]OOY45484.1 hypothetical protein BOV93_13020 [Solemya velum gill symbiont]OOY49848.1 hypothetical protein BOV97_12320 [Solemya velum gill symbiont]OOY54259.1 hypothetical protein BOV99_11725 [Solemya velum gill symbiont]